MIGIREHEKKIGLIIKLEKKKKKIKKEKKKKKKKKILPLCTANYEYLQIARHSLIDC